MLHGGMRILYLQRDELVVLLQSLARSVRPDEPPPEDPTECSRVVWDSHIATPIQRSLATALVEATYQ